MTAKTYNAFTKSYRLRYVVHAAEKGGDKTLCGRAAEKVSNKTFDEEAEGACKKCIGKIAIGRRVHPGWDE